MTVCCVAVCLIRSLIVTVPVGGMSPLPAAALPHIIYNSASVPVSLGAIQQLQHAEDVSQQQPTPGGTRSMDTAGVSSGIALLGIVGLFAWSKQ